MSVGSSPAVERFGRTFAAELNLNHGHEGPDPEPATPRLDPVHRRLCSKLREDLLDFILTEKRIVGTAAHMGDVDISAAVGLLANGVVNTAPLLTDVIGLNEVPTKGFDRLVADKNVFKIAVNPSK